MLRSSRVVSQTVVLICSCAFLANIAYSFFSTGVSLGSDHSIYTYIPIISQRNRLLTAV